MKTYYLLRNNQNYLVVTSDNGKAYSEIPMDKPEENTIVRDIAMGKYDKEITKWKK